MNYLKAQLGFKGERGYSAYEIAVQNGFEGTEQDWLATLGTSSHLTQEKAQYTSTEGQTEFNLPSNYTTDTFVDVYVDGTRLTSNEYTISNNKVVLDTGLEADKTVELIVMTMSTNNLPIVTTIDGDSTNDTTPSTKTVYDNILSPLNINIRNLNQLDNNVEQLTDSVSSLTDDINNIETVVNNNYTEQQRQLNDLQPFTLWTNPDSEPDNFIPQTVSLTTSDYDYLEVYYYTYSGKKTIQSLKINKGVNFELMTVFSHNNSLHHGARAVAYVDDTTLNFKIAYASSTNNVGVIAATSDWIVPIKIIGYKTL